MSFNGENNFHKHIFSNLNHFNWQREIIEEGKKKDSRFHMVGVRCGISVCILISTMIVGNS
jgi:hypothetical protein